MSFIERAVKVLEARHFSGRDESLPPSEALSRPTGAEITQPASVGIAQAIDIAGLGEASTGGSSLNQRQLNAVVDEETLIPRASDVIDEEEPSADTDRPEPYFSPATDSDLNDEALGQDEVDTYTGAIFRNSTDRVRAAHVRALRAKIDQVEASVDQAHVSMPSAPVRAARAALTAASGAAGLAESRADNEDQPPLLSMRNVVRESEFVDKASTERTEPAQALAGITAPSQDQAVAAPAQAGIAPRGAGGKLRLRGIHAQAYLDPEGREDPLREAFEPMADELLEQMAADAAASTPMGRRIMVTSAEHGVGRSLCGVHLALSLVVDHGQTVCYIDLDFSGAPIVPALGIRPGAGVADWLDGLVQTIDALVVPTELAGLKLIAPGSAAAISRRAARLDRQSMNAFLLAYSARYPEDLVVMGAPALDDQANATMLAGLAGQVVVVVEANKTQRKQLVGALDALQRHSRVSLMLNKMDR